MSSRDSEDPRAYRAFAADRAPVRITVPSGWWRFLPTREADGAGSVTAQLVRWNADNASADLVVTAVRRTVWDLEQTLGFRLPATVEGLLHHGQPRDDLVLPWPDGGWRAAQGQLLVDVGLDPADQPWRASWVNAGGFQTTYGRRMHSDRPLRSWQHEPYMVEIVGAYRDNPVLDSEPLQLTYRICLGDRVVFAGDDVTIPSELAGGSDDAVREVIRQALDRPRDPRDLTYVQQSFLDVQRERLALRTLGLAPPYSPGSRVRVDLQGGMAATGVVRGPVVRNGRTTGYLWRPDVADLPGHPGYRNPDYLRYAEGTRVRDTLAAKDTAIEGQGGPVVLTFGATVASVDDPRFDRGRVLRAVDDDGLLVYDVEPDNNRGASYRLDVDDVIPLSGTAWPTVDRLLEARAAAGVALVPGEILVTLREIAMMPYSGRMVPAALVRQELHSPDRLLDPDTPSAAVDVVPADGLPGHLPALDPFGTAEPPPPSLPELPDTPDFDSWGDLDL